MKYCDCPRCLIFMQLALALVDAGRPHAADRIAAMVTVLDENDQPIPFASAPIADEGYADTWVPPRDDATVN